jgi:hypothetical protein
MVFILFYLLKSLAENYVSILIIVTIFVNLPLRQSSLEIIPIYYIHIGEVIYRR